MSTQNKEQLKLYKNQYLYNGSRYQYLLTGTQNSAYQAFESWLGTPSFNKEVYYKSINEPITINEYIKNCDEYTYGSITNEGKTYYFFVDNILTDAYKQTTINYTVDWWTTNWFNINCTKAHLTRKPVRPMYMKQPYSPLNVSSNQDILTDKFTIFATYIPSIETTKEYETSDGTKQLVLTQTNSFISYVLLEGTKENVQKVSQGTWYQEYRLAGSDIKDCFIVPFFEIDDFRNQNLNPIFSVYVKADLDRTPTSLLPLHNAGVILKAFCEKYSCFNGLSPDAVYEEPNMFTGDEIIYNEWNGKYYYPEWIPVTSGSRWRLQPFTSNPVQGSEVIDYWLY